MTERSCVSVALPLPMSGALTYALPADGPPPSPGSRVEVPVGRRLLIGVVLDDPQPIQTKHDDSLKAIVGVLDSRAAVPPALLALLRWVADYYLAPIGEVVKLALPPGLLSGERLNVRLLAAGKQLSAGLPVAGMPKLSPAALQKVLETLAKLPSEGRVTLSAAFRKTGRIDNATLARWAEWGLIELQAANDRRSREKSIAIIAAAASPDVATEALGRAKKQAEVFAALCACGPVARSEFCDGDPARARAISELVKRGLVSVARRRVYRSPLGQHLLPAADGDDAARTLWPDQTDALSLCKQQLVAESPRPVLLYGEPGSGKTEVYLQLAAATLQAGRSVLVLAPEISLTPQLVSRFVRRFGDVVAVWHSALSPGERFDEWQRIRKGEARIVIGARSAVFAPLENLGLIVVDEEQDGSYKSDERVFFQARDVAVMRGVMENAAVVLGSATPSVEAIGNVRRGRWLESKLARPEKRPLPTIKLVDMASVRTSKKSQLSAELVLALEKRLAAGEQSILFINRRGWAPSLVCRACKEPVTCRHCAVTMTYHRTVGQMMCHACGATGAYPERCPACGRDELELVGIGTQRVEDELELTFPEARIARLDRDAAARRGKMAEVLTRFAAHELDILVGTQLVTKGHDFPDVTLVGVLMADVSLNLPDFRAAERSFQLLTQVAGRAGRGDKPGEVIIQTFQPRHVVLSCVQHGDAARFYESELTVRSGLYPPSKRLALLRFESPGPNIVRQAATHVGNRLRRLAAECPGVLLLGPAPAPVEKIRGHYRMRLLVRADTPGALHRFLQQANARQCMQIPRDVRLQVDVDPGSMM